MDCLLHCLTVFEVYFVIIGKLMDKDFKKLKTKNILFIDRKTSEELVEYYSSADICLPLHRDGSVMGIVAEEALACGTPIIHSKEIGAKNSPAIYKVSHSGKDVSKALRKYIELPKKRKREISKIAREFAKRYYSDDAWKNKYIKYYLGN